jgi:U3 small nucleolar RNA-associated protein 19
MAAAGKKSATGGVKRKSSATQAKPVKRAKSETPESSDDEDDIQEQVLALEAEILESKKHYNNIPKLIKILETEDAVIAAIALCRVFSRLMASGEMTKQPKASEKELVVVAWLKERYLEYKNGLLELLESPEVAPTIFALCLRLLKSEGQHFKNGQDYAFPTRFLTDIVRTLLTAEDAEEVRKEFSEKYVEENDDVRYYTLEAIATIMNEEDGADTQRAVDNAIEILSSIESVPEDAEELEDFYIPKPKKKSHNLYSLNAHKKVAQEAWLAVFRSELTKEQRKMVLGMMTSLVAPWFNKPELLMDFLVDSYNSGGSTSLLALSGVFYLIQERNLDYPDFYKKLYSLLDSGLLHSKHRSKFFRLLDTFMSSTHLPAVLVASFIKRLSRLALNAPPAGIVAIVPWIYNMLRRHPTCTFMIHREVRTEEEKEQLEQEGMDDPFNPDEEDPMETNAIDSCLWELVTLQSHYHPNVATIAKIISEQFTKQQYNLEDFLDHSYGSVSHIPPGFWSAVTNT